jgi:hypothetical protein
MGVAARKQRPPELPVPFFNSPTGSEPSGRCAPETALTRAAGPLFQQRHCPERLGSGLGTSPTPHYHPELRDKPASHAEIDRLECAHASLTDTPNVQARCLTGLVRTQPPSVAHEARVRGTTAGDHHHDPVCSLPRAMPAGRYSAALLGRVPATWWIDHHDRSSTEPRRARVLAILS